MVATRSQLVPTELRNERDNEYNANYVKHPKNAAPAFEIARWLIWERDFSLIDLIGSHFHLPH